MLPESLTKAACGAVCCSQTEEKNMLNLFAKPVPAGAPDIKVLDPGQIQSLGIKPTLTVETGGETHTVDPSDPAASKAASQLIDDARESGTITMTSGVDDSGMPVVKNIPTDSPEGQVVLQKAYFMGQGESAVNAEKIAKLKISDAYKTAGKEDPFKPAWKPWVKTNDNQGQEDRNPTKKPMASKKVPRKPQFRG